MANTRVSKTKEFHAAAKLRLKDFLSPSMGYAGDDLPPALQGFPQDFTFCGSRCDQYRQIGNSVPPPFARHIAAAVMKMFKARDAESDSCGGNLKK